MSERTASSIRTRAAPQSAQDQGPGTLQPAEAKIWGLPGLQGAPPLDGEEREV